MTTTTLDARGLKCPMPVLMAKKALRNLPPGAELELLATDRGVDADVIDLCDITGARLIAASFENGVHRFLLRTGSAAPSPAGNS